ncbi:hypothetical protein [Halopseudomonas salegens]|uniref:Uncharacterized protein n=1 Tax=Halopseudomonas salegens TaxID=1434072 RepID=A0A1H2EAA7_9GAMM|nr:hypothetical protein [Halopseudomonas salegens]SDT91929.1 hypothetical protein SAMN05216210_0500 [Halopseudomonas salegens]
MQLSQLKSIRQAQAGAAVEIVSHSCMSGFLARLRLDSGKHIILHDRSGKPRVWLALDQLKRDLRRQGITSTELHLCVAQDEVIRQPGMPTQAWDS